jgi:hypothetical protein
MHRLNSKKNIEFAIGYIQKIIGTSINTIKKINILDECWENFLEGNIKATTKELSVPNGISDDIIQSLLKK